MDKKFYFEKLRISYKKTEKMSSSHQDEENLISYLVEENYIVKSNDDKCECIKDNSKYLCCDEMVDRTGL